MTISFYELIGGLLAAVAFFGYLNHRLLKLPTTIGITVIGLLFSLGATFLGMHNPKWVAWAEMQVNRIDFAEVVLHGMLGLLLFAGALTMQVRMLAQYWLPVFALATVGVLISTWVVGVGLWLVLQQLGYHLKMVHCLMFGALIAPTDPVVVLSVLKRYAVPDNLRAIISGEALFNDGTAVASFLILLSLSTGTAAVSAPWALGIFFTEIVGGIVIGLALGGLALLLLRSVDQPQVEILVTLAVATGGYALAERLHTSAPLAVVSAGLLVGAVGPGRALSEHSEEALFSFWELSDELLNLLLFGMIGILAITLDFSWDHLWVALLAIPIVLVGRWISVLLPSLVLRPTKGPDVGLVTLMTWGGLRGGISLALALSLPMFAGRDYIIAATYGVVVFSLLVQALTMGPLIEWLLKKPAPGTLV